MELAGHPRARSEERVRSQGQLYTADLVAEVGLLDFDALLARCRELENENEELQGAEREAAAAVARIAHLMDGTVNVAGEGVSRATSQQRWMSDHRDGQALVEYFTELQELNAELKHRRSALADHVGRIAQMNAEWNDGIDATRPRQPASQQYDSGTNSKMEPDRRESMRSEASIRIETLPSPLRRAQRCKSDGIKLRPQPLRFDGQGSDTCASSSTGSPRSGQASADSSASERASLRIAS